MARQRTSPFENLVLLVSKLPWWVGMALALVSYLVLHVIASRPAVPVSGPGQMGDVVVKGFTAIMAKFGQYLLPFGFSIGAMISAINSARRKRLYNSVASRSGARALSEMSWSEFEDLVGEYYRRDGFQVTRQGGNGPDGGIDLVLRRNREIYLVQCKQWKAYKVGVQPVREFYGVMASKGVAGGYFVTSGEFTQEAKTFAQGLNLELVDGPKLRKMIDTTQQTAPPPADFRMDSGGPASKDSADSSLPPVGPVFPTCPKCGAAMKKRVARQGANSGKEFWGCITFPKCKGILPMGDSIVDQVQAALPLHPVPVVTFPERRNCPNCGAEMALRHYKSGPRIGQQFYGCVPCKKGWPIHDT